MDKGWIKLHRVILENHFLMHDAKAFCVFTKLLMLVGKQKGQWSGGRKDLAEFMDMNENTLYSVLKRLEKEQIVNIEPNTRYTVYTICNWHKYQQTAQQVNQPHVNNTATTRQHYNKKKKEKKNNTGDLILGNTKQQIASEETRRKVREQLTKKGIVRAVRL